MRDSIVCFSPVAGIQWVETWGDPFFCPANERKGFSPVAGIQWVETIPDSAPNVSDRVGFSPVAGIQWVETSLDQHHSDEYWASFSPVAGIQWVETLSIVRSPKAIVLFQSRCRDSVG